MTTPQVLYSRNKKQEKKENGTQESPGLINMGGIIRQSMSPEEIAQAQFDANKETARMKLENLLEKTDTILLNIKTVFPFVLFPTILVIDLNKVDIVHQEFFFSDRRHCIEIKDIADVYVDTSLIFASLKIVIKDMRQKIISISYLKKREAKKARKIIQGLITAHREQIDLITLKDEHLLDKIEALGSINPG